MDPQSHQQINKKVNGGRLRKGNESYGLTIFIEHVTCCKSARFRLCLSLLFKRVCGRTNLDNAKTPKS